MVSGAEMSTALRIPGADECAGKTGSNSASAGQSPPLGGAHSHRHYELTDQSLYGAEPRPGEQIY